MGSPQQFRLLHGNVVAKNAMTTLQKLVFYIIGVNVSLFSCKTNAEDLSFCHHRPGNFSVLCFKTDVE